ncbi:hypothetical protein [Nostoc sp. PA-18-2419]|uniref:hypothetical protein n=1 Tax=Nostoc sp. PA-18-2419 TaxID=2575443 RepID=UPI00110893C1|nr:hypothetical protein [Nostoc sp. PA-18-2419]
MAEKILYQGVTIEISEIVVGTNQRLEFRLIDSQGKEIGFVRSASVVNYSTQHKELLIKDAQKEIDRLIQEGQII